MTETKTDDNVGAGLGCLVLIGLAAYGGYWLWQQADHIGWIWHDKLTIVVAKAWSTGEYKTCSEPNIDGMQQEPQIDCSDNESRGEPKRFKVRFYGDTYKVELRDKASFTWLCKKNEGTDPAITCDQQKIIKWNDSK